MATTIRDRQAWTRRRARREAEYLQRGVPRCQSPTATATTADRQDGGRMAGSSASRAGRAPGRASQAALSRLASAPQGLGYCLTPCPRVAPLRFPATAAGGCLYGPTRLAPFTAPGGRGGAIRPRARPCSHAGRDLLKGSRTGAPMADTRGKDGGRISTDARATESVDSPIRAGHGAGRLPAPAPKEQAPKAVRKRS